MQPKRLTYNTLTSSKYPIGGCKQTLNGGLTEFEATSFLPVGGDHTILTSPPLPLYGPSHEAEPDQPPRLPASSLSRR